MLVKEDIYKSSYFVQGLTSILLALAIELIILYLSRIIVDVRFHWESDNL